MNYLAHGWHAVPCGGPAAAGDAWFLAGTALPDWLRVVARRLRATPDRAAACEGAADPCLAALARGALRHFRDDVRFHASPAFAAASREVADLVRPLGAGTPALRPSFVGHVLVEMLLDAELARRDPARLDAYYATLATLDADEIERRAAPLATRPPDGLAPLVRAFVSSRFLGDYGEDARLAHRLGQVLRRARQPAPRDGLMALLPAARDAVAARVGELVPGP